MTLTVTEGEYFGILDFILYFNLLAPELFFFNFSTACI